MTDRGSTAVSIGEEIANSITHGLGFLLSVAGLCVLVVMAVLRGTAWHVVACSIYGSTLVFLYLSSTLYHAIQAPRAKNIFRVIDHSAIYLLIAGTYTPFLLITLRGPLGWTLFGLQWGMAICGILFKSLTRGGYEIASTAVYALMGWMGVLGMRTMYASLHFRGVLWILAGGVFYTLGIIFFAIDRRYCHTVWHLFVLAGSVCHFYAVLRFIVLR
jgi:hemolysin III